MWAVVSQVEDFPVSYDGHSGKTGCDESAPTSVVLAVENPLCSLQERRFYPTESCRKHNAASNSTATKQKSGD